MPEGKDGGRDLRPLNRASGRFATTFAAGSLAIKYQIFRWSREDLLEAILTCQLDGCGIPRPETSRPIPPLLASVAKLLATSPIIASGS